LIYSLNLLIQNLFFLFYPSKIIWKATLIQLVYLLYLFTNLFTLKNQFYNLISHNLFALHYHLTQFIINFSNLIVLKCTLFALLIDLMNFIVSIKAFIAFLIIWLYFLSYF